MKLFQCSRSYLESLVRLVWWKPSSIQTGISFKFGTQDSLMQLNSIDFKKAVQLTDSSSIELEL